MSSLNLADYSSPPASPYDISSPASLSYEASAPPALDSSNTASTNSVISESEEELVVMGRLIPRAVVTRVKTVNASACKWDSIIEGTYTKPLFLVIGISLGAILGMLFVSWSMYQYGKVAKGPGGGAMMGGGMGGAPPPA